MRLQKISPYQLFALIFLFEVGSAVLFGLGFDAEHDAWLAILFALAGGILVLLLYIWLYYRYPNLTFVGYTKRNLGFLGTLISHVYIVYFIYIAARVTRDLGELTLLYLLPETPLIVLNLLGLLLIGYALFLGIEVIARTAELTIGVVYIFFSFLILMTFFSGLVKIENLLPVFDTGLPNILKVAYPQIITFPFGEIVVFTMIFPYLNQKNKVMKTAIVAFTIVGLTLSFISAIIYSILGGGAMSCTFPFVCAVRLIEVADFIQRFEGTVILFLLIGGYCKITLFLYAALTAFKEVYKTDTYKQFVIPTLLMVLLLSIMISEHLAKHLEVGLKVVTFYVHIPLQLGIPLLVLLISLIRRDRLSNQESNKN